MIRLDKYLADMKVGTRSEVKEYIRKRRVSVDGEIVNSPETKIDIESQTVALDGQTVGYVSKEYYMLNKPAGVLTATMDKKARTVLDLIDGARKDLFPVGRLDKDTEGLLLITNDGRLAHELLSPKKHVDKVYYARVRGSMGEKEINAFAAGLKVDEQLTAMPAKLEVLRVCRSSEVEPERTVSEVTERTVSKVSEGAVSEVIVTVHEGKFHQVKRMFLAAGSEVLYLKRLSMGTLKLDENLTAGQYRALTKAELDELLGLVGMTAN